MGEGDGEGEVLGDGKGPTPIVKGVMGSDDPDLLDVWEWELWLVEEILLASLIKKNENWGVVLKETWKIWSFIEEIWDFVEQTLKKLGF